MKKPDKVYERKSSIAPLMVMIALLSIVGGQAVAIDVAADTGDASLASYASFAMPLGVFTLVGGVVTIGLYAATDKKDAVAAAGVVTIVLLATTIGAVAAGAIGGTDTDEPPPGYSAKWSCNWLPTTGTAHDIATEFPDTPFTAADGGSPDYNGVIGTPIVNLDLKQVLWEFLVDNEDATPAGWLAEDAWAADAKCVLQNPLNAVGGGVQNVPIWGKISVSRTMGATGNSTSRPVFTCDSTAGHYLGFGKVADAGSVTASHTNDHEYVSYTSSTSCGVPPLEGEWINLGGTGTTTVQNGVYISAWMVFLLASAGNPHSGLSSYEDADQTLQVQIDLGDDPTDATWQGNVQSLYIQVQATHD